MIITDEGKKLLTILEDAYSGAMMMDDVDTQVRLARAIKAFEMDTGRDIIITYGSIQEDI